MVINVKKLTDKPDAPKKRISDSVKAGILRWWIVGMCYYLVAMGLEVGMSESPLDLILLLGIGTGLATVVIYEPVAYGAFDVRRKGVNLSRRYKGTTGWKRAMENLAEVARSLLIVFLVYLTYQNINMILVRLAELPEDTVVIPGEPFGFAALFVFFHWLLAGLAESLRRIIPEKGRVRAE